MLSPERRCIRDYGDGYDAPYRTLEPVAKPPFATIPLAAEKIFASRPRRYAYTSHGTTLFTAVMRHAEPHADAYASPHAMTSFPPESFWEAPQHARYADAAIRLLLVALRR